MFENDLAKTALTKAMALCAGREYSTGDIRKKLNSWGIGSVDSELIIKTLVKENFINETRYASAYVADKFRYNKWGKIKLTSQLRARGIPEDIIKSSLDGIDDEQYRNTLQEIMKTYRKTVRAKNQYDLKGKLMRFGLSRGFESNLLYDLLEDFT
jgi:regulatory protein